MSLTVEPVASGKYTVRVDEASVKTQTRSTVKDSLNSAKEEGCLENTKAFFSSIKKSFVAACYAIWQWILENIFCKKEPLIKRYQKADEAVVKSQEDWVVARVKFEKAQRLSEEKSEGALNAFSMARFLQQHVERPHTKQTVLALIEAAQSFSDAQKVKYKKAYEESPKKLHQTLQKPVLLGQFLISYRQVIAFQEYLSLDPKPKPLEAQVAFTHLLPRSKEIILELTAKRIPNVKTEQDVFEYLSTKEAVSKCATFCYLYVESNLNRIDKSS